METDTEIKLQDAAIQFQLAMTNMDTKILHQLLYLSCKKRHDGNGEGKQWKY